MGDVPKHTPETARARLQKAEDMLDTAPLRDAYRALLDAAAGADQARSRRLAGGTPTRSWPSSVASGANTTYDNRIALDAWTIKRLIARRRQCGTSRPRPPPRGVPLRTGRVGAERGRARHAGAHPAPVQGHGPGRSAVPMRDLITGLADVELPTRTRQLLSLLPDGATPG